MQFNNLEEIWAAESRYDLLRWSPEKPLSELPIEQIRQLRSDLPNAISALTIWIDNKSISNSDKTRLGVVRKKLQDFQWNIIKEEHRREKSKFRVERLEAIVEPEAHGHGATSRNYGLKSPLKGSDFYKDIPDGFGPQPKEGRR